MVLFVDGKCVENQLLSTHSLFQRHPFLVSRAREWKQADVKQVSECGTLYVAQRELAIVPSTVSSVKVVGSEDATTCHIVIFRHKPSNSVAVAHFDGGRNEEAAIGYMVTTLVGDSLDRAVDVFAIGGFYTSSTSVKGVEESHKLSLKLLTIMMKLDYKFNLSQWFCCELNTLRSSSGLVRPRYHGLCWDRVSNSAHPAAFATHGPDSTLRSASAWAASRSHMTSIYDWSSSSITIFPFFGDQSHDWQLYSTLSDEELLLHFSTSPTAEPKNFCSQMRALFSMLANHPDPVQTLFHDGKPKVYVLRGDGVWKLNI